MNERFLFRGKRKDNGAWETGFLVITRYDCSDEQYFITDKMTGYHTPVILETVGQYTGLKDKNGKLIFEGDIVFVCDDNGFADLSDTGKGNVISYKGIWYIGGEIQNSLYDICRNYYVEVIGNIHFRR